MRKFKKLFCFIDLKSAETKQESVTPNLKAGKGANLTL
jgi:hypothetical protein